MKLIVDEIIEKLPEEFNMIEIMGKVEERTPYVIVAFQECQRMNLLTSELKRSLKELDLGLKVMQTLPLCGNNIFLSKLTVCSKLAGGTDHDSNNGIFRMCDFPGSSPRDMGAEGLPVPIRTYCLVF